LNGEILQWGALEKILLHKVGGDKKNLGTYGVIVHEMILFNQSFQTI